MRHTCKFWTSLNKTSLNSQRVHQNTLERVPIFLAILLSAGLFNAKMAAAFGFLWLIGRVIYSLGYYTGKPNNRLAGSLVRNVDNAVRQRQRQIMFFITDRPGFCRVSSGHHDVLTMWTVRKVVGHSPGVLKSHSNRIWTEFIDNTKKLKYSQTKIFKSKGGSNKDSRLTKSLH